MFEVCHQNMGTVSCNYLYIYIGLYNSDIVSVVLVVFPLDYRYRNINKMTGRREGTRCCFYHLTPHEPLIYRFGKTLTATEEH